MNSIELYQLRRVLGGRSGDYTVLRTLRDFLPLGVDEENRVMNRAAIRCRSAINRVLLGYSLSPENREALELAYQFAAGNETLGEWIPLPEGF